MKPGSLDFPVHPALFVSGAMRVREDWIDYNGHMNLAYYHVLFDRCCDEFVPKIGCGSDYRKRTNYSIFTVDARVRYLRELNIGDTVSATLHILNSDSKRVHLALTLFHTDGWLSATSELLWLHVDQSGPKAAPFPNNVLEKIRAHQRAHAQADVPEWIGESVAKGIFNELKKAQLK